MSFSEHLGRKTRYKLFCLVYNAVKESTDQERERLKKKHKRIGKGRPPYVSKVAELLGVSRETVSAWKKKSYQAMNPNAVLLLNEAYELNKEKTVEILYEDVEFHKRMVEEFLKSKQGRTADGME